MTWQARRWLSARWPARTRLCSPPRRAGTACRSISSTRPSSPTFSFGSIVNRSPVVIGISTGGARAGAGASDPRQDRGDAASRARRLGRGGAAAARDRQGAAAHGSGAPRCVAAVCRSGACGPRRADARRLARPRLVRHLAMAARVALVGAGPGDPELLTLKALRALQSADVILYDRLVSPEILELARREARRMLVGKAGGGASCRQDDINRLMVRPGARRQARGAPQGRRPHAVRPRRRGACRLPRRRHSRGGRSRHHGGARRRRRAAGAADRPAPHPPRAIRHRARRGRRCSGARLAEPGRSVDRSRRST